MTKYNELLADIDLNSTEIRTLHAIIKVELINLSNKIRTKKVLKIIRVSTISIPKTMSTILVSSKCERVGKIEVRS